MNSALTGLIVVAAAVLAGRWLRRRMLDHLVCGPPHTADHREWNR